MKIFTNIAGYKKKHPLVLALGNFDGVHRGHRHILRLTRQEARSLKARSGVLVLDPHPLSILVPEKDLFLLTSLDEKARLIQETGIDYLVVAPFDREFARLSPREFVERVLVEQLQVQAVVAGYDYAFGSKASGKVSRLVELGERRGFRVEVVEPVKIKGRVVSSSLIRRLIQVGKVEEAREFLGYSPFLRGRVVTGEGRGSSLGFPTANLEVPMDSVVPARGVYFTLACFRDQVCYSLTNIGCKPTFQGETRTIEVHVLDFQEDLYGQELRVKFLQRVRDETAFAGAGELKQQVEKDIKKARGLIEKFNPRALQVIEYPGHLLYNSNGPLVRA